MSKKADPNNIENQHSALDRLWPNDAKESKKLAEEKQQKLKNLVTLGEQLKISREELGYNISDLNDHLGLSFSEIEAMEHGLFKQVENQEYIDYYVHSYAALLGLDENPLLEYFQQNYHKTADVNTKTEPTEIANSNETITVVADENQSKHKDTTDLTTSPTQIDKDEINYQDSHQFEDAFTEEATKTIAALNAAELENYTATEHFITNHAKDEQAKTSEPKARESSPDANGSNQEPKEQLNSEKSSFQSEVREQTATSSHDFGQQRSFPWAKLLIAFTIVTFIALTLYYYKNTLFTPNQTGAISSETVKNSQVNKDKLADKIPENQKAKKIGDLETKIIKQGSNDLSAKTATSKQTDLPLPKPANTVDENTKQEIKKQSAASPTTNKISKVSNQDAINKILKNTLEDLPKEQPKSDGASLSTKQTNLPQSNLEKTLSGAAKATKEKVETLVKTTTNTTPAPLTSNSEKALQSKALPEENQSIALAQLPKGTDKYSLHALQNSWVLIEDEDAQILFSGELEPKKIITLSKINNVIISLGDAGVINVYKGDKLLGKLGEPDETLNLVSIQQRLNNLTK